MKPLLTDPRIRIAAFIVCLCGRASAQTTLTWTGAGLDTNWSTTANWTPVGTPTNGDTVVFGDGGAATGGVNPVTSVLDIPSLSLHTLRFENDAGTHHVHLNANSLGVTYLVEHGRNRFGHTNVATLSNGALSAGTAGTPLENYQVGYRNAAGAFVEGRQALALTNVSVFATRLDVGRIYNNNQNGVRGILDLTACDAVAIDAGRVYLGTINGNGITWGSEGQLLLPLAGTAMIRTPQLWVGDSNPAGNTSRTSLMELGSNAVIHADNFTVARRKCKGTVRFAAGVTGGTLALSGDAQGAADLHIGYNAAATGSNGEGKMDLRGGTFNATLDQVVLGRHNSGNGSGKGSLYFSSGTVTANSVLLAQSDASGSSANDANTTGRLEMDGGMLTVADSVTDGNGFSSVMVDGGDMVVSNAFSTDDFRVGYNGGAGTIDVDGAVRLGSGTEWLDVSIRDSGNLTTTGRADFADAPSVTINANLLRLGWVDTGSSGQSSGTLLLSESGTNAISVNRLDVGDSDAAGNTTFTSEIRFGGGTNTVAVNEINVGKRKSRGVATIGDGGVVTITSRTGGDANLYVGRNNINTGTNCEGTFGLTNGTLNARFNRVVLGLHNQGNGSGKGTFIMGPGEVTANEIILGNPSASATSANPQNTHGNLLIRDGTVMVQGDVRDAGGTSRIEVSGGELSVRGDFIADTVDLGVAGGTNASLVLNGDAGQTWLVGTFEHVSAGTLQFNVGGGMPVLRCTDASFSAGAGIAVGVTDDGGPNTNLAAATVWVGGSNAWDDVTDAHWSSGVPAAHAIVVSNTAVTVVTASNLTDNGLTCVSTGWTVNVTPGANGTVDVVRVGGALDTGQRWARISSTNAFVTRDFGLLVGDTPGSGAGASGLLLEGGALRIAGDVASDGGYTPVRIDGGDVEVTGAFEADAFRLGYLGRTARLAVSNGVVRVGDPAVPELVDIARREGGQGGVKTVGHADFAYATGVELAAAQLRIGTANSVNGPVFEGQLALAATGTNRISAGTVTIGDSPLEGAGSSPNGPTNALHFGGGENLVEADVVYVARRKIVGRADIVPDGTLTMRGLNVAGTKLRIGFNDAGTGTLTDGVLDLSGVTFDATLDELLVARHNTGNGGGAGTFVMDAGSVTVASNVELARVSVGGTSTSPGKTVATVVLNGGRLDVSGQVLDGGGVSSLTLAGADVTAPTVRNIDTLSLSGGSLEAGVITNTAGITDFTFSGGRLTADRIGTGTNLVQSGGTLAPGSAVGTTDVYGNYEVASGTWELDYGTGSNDMVVVHGTLTLGAGSRLELNKLTPTDTDKLVIGEYETLSGTFSQTAGLATGAEVVYHYGPTGRQIAIVKRGTMLLVR